MLANERPKEITEEYTHAIYPEEVGQLARELLAIREAGDEEVEKLYNQPHEPEARKNLRDIAIVRGQQLREAQAENTRLEQDLARLKVEYADLESRFDATNKACDIFEKNSKAAADLCDENWKLKAEIERLQLKLDHKNQQVESQSTLVNEMQSQIATLTSELAALKSAPGMAEIDEILKRALSPDCNGDSTFQALYRDNLADLARRFAASREEVVGLLKWLWKIIVCNGQILAYIRRCDKPEAKAILEIVEGK